MNMTPEQATQIIDLLNGFQNIGAVLVVAVGVVAGLKIGQAFSFWKW